MTVNSLPMKATLLHRDPGGVRMITSFEPGDGWTGGLPNTSIKYHGTQSLKDGGGTIFKNYSPELDLDAMVTFSVKAYWTLNSPYIGSHGDLQFYAIDGSFNQVARTKVNSWGSLSGKPANTWYDITWTKSNFNPLNWYDIIQVQFPILNVVGPISLYIDYWTMTILSPGGHSRIIARLPNTPYHGRVR